jgi:cytochrome P450
MGTSIVGRMTLKPTTTLRRWAGRKLLAGSGGTGSSGLYGMSIVPKKLTWPLRRVEMDPVPALAVRRAAEPVSKLSRVMGMTVWMVTGYEEAKFVLNDAIHFSTDIRSLLGAGTDQTIGGLGFTDPPDHTRLRKFLTPEFTMRRLAGLLPRIEQIVEERLDALEAGGPVVDIVPEFAFPVPFFVICELLGLPVEDRERFRGLGHARFDITGGGAGTFGAMSESSEFLLKEIQAQRRHPGDGLIGAILRDQGDEITDLELAGLADGVFTGGYESSASMLALGTLALLRDPAAFDLIRRDDDAVDGVVDELLRYLTVVQIAFPRFARHDLDLFGKRVKSGDVVVCSLSGANRDDVFGSLPERFDPTRRAPSHLAFGHGFHRCVGSELARMELRVALQAMARRFPDLCLAVEPSELQFRDLSIVYGVDSLPVRLNLTTPRIPQKTTGCGSI